MKKYIRIIIAGIIIFLIFSGTVILKNRHLEGLHLLQNITGNGQYTFYVDAKQTGLHEYNVSRFNKNARYTVYNTQSEKLVSEGRFGYRSEGYYPFIEMMVENGNTYKIIIFLEDKFTFGWADIEYLD